MIVCNPSFGQISLTRLKGDSVCQDVNSYKRETIAIRTLLNAYDEQSELMQIKDFEIINLYKEIETRELMDSIRVDTIVGLRDENKVVSRKIKQRNKLLLITLAALVVENLLLFR